MNILERQITFEAALPNVVQEIKAAPLLGAFDVKNEIVFADRILRTKVLKIFDKSTLVLAGVYSEPFIAIAAQEMIIDNPSVRAVFTRPSSASDITAIANKLRGADGTVGAGGGDGLYTDQHGHGAPGGNGYEGGAGMPGRTFDLPPVFIFVQEIRLGTGTTPLHECVEMYFDGYRGGFGGIGGKGGTGGRGHEGAQGEENFWGCTRGGGRGGDGGMGGMPGLGGSAGRGGNGATVVFVAPLPKIDTLKFFSVRQEGGLPGEPGQRGNPGDGGPAGGAGRGTARCGGGVRGTDGYGRSVARLDSGLGSTNLKGTRGQQDYVVRINTDLF